MRQNERDKVFAVLNFSKAAQTVKFEDAGLYQGTYTDYFSGEKVDLSAATQLSLKPWEYRVYVK